MTSEQAKFANNLCRKFASGLDHEDRGPNGAIAMQPVDQRNQERRGFAAAGFGGGDHVTSQSE